MNPLLNKQAKMQRLSKILHHVMLIGAFSVAILFILQLILIFILAYHPQTLTGTPFMTDCKMGIFELKLATSRQAIGVLIFTLLNSAVAFPIVVLISQIFKDISHSHSPFTNKQTRRLKAISLLMLSMTLAVPVLHWLLTVIFLPDVKARLFLDLTGLIFAAVFRCLALIFDHGSELQQQADETL